MSMHGQWPLQLVTGEPALRIKQTTASARAWLAGMQAHLRPDLG
jgi:hypothetical protein